MIMSYLDKTLIFEEDRIYYTDEDVTSIVMMSWEDSIMKASADYICENGGDILEIGFGMGISANYIQANSITSHTIVEGDWYDVKDSLSTYDGVFYDTWGDDNALSFVSELPNFTKAGTRVTWWNNYSDTDDVLYINGTTYQSISVNPDSNMYFQSNTYHLPKKQF